MNIASDIFGSSNNNKLPLILERHRKKIFHLREMFSIVFCLQYEAELQYWILLIIHPRQLAWLAWLGLVRPEHEHGHALCGGEGGDAAEPRPGRHPHQRGGGERGAHCLHSDTPLQLSGDGECYHLRGLELLADGQTVQHRHGQAEPRLGPHRRHLRRLAARHLGEVVRAGELEHEHGAARGEQLASGGEDSGGVVHVVQRDPDQHQQHRGGAQPGHLVCQAAVGLHLQNTVSTAPYLNTSSQQ